MNNNSNPKRVTSALLKVLLKSLALAGYAGVIVVAPNIVQAIDMLLPKSCKQPKSANRFAYYAQRNGYITVEKMSKNRYAITLTQKGHAAAEDILFTDYQIPKQREWDGKWRVLLFDISENQRSLRDDLRSAITNMGFLLIQNSVYVYPYPIDEFVSKLHKRYPQSANRVISMTADEIDGHDQLVSAFKKSGVL